MISALLEQIGGRHVDGDALGRQRQAERAQGRAHPLAALGDRLVGQADQGDSRVALTGAKSLPRQSENEWGGPNRLDFFEVFLYNGGVIKISV